MPSLDVRIAPQEQIEAGHERENGSSKSAAAARADDPVANRPRFDRRRRLARDLRAGSAARARTPPPTSSRNAGTKKKRADVVRLALEARRLLGALEAGESLLHAIDAEALRIERE